MNSCGKDWKRRCWQAARHSLTEPARAQVVLAEDGASASAHSNLGNVHLQTGQPALALQDFDTAVSLAPEARARRRPAAPPRLPPIAPHPKQASSSCCSPWPSAAQHACTGGCPFREARVQCTAHAARLRRRCPA